MQEDIERSAASTPSALFKDGALLNVNVVVNGLTVTLEPIDATKPMLCFIAGEFEVIPPVVLTFGAGKPNGTDSIYLDWVLWRVTHDGTYNGQSGCLTDAGLIDTATNEPVGERGQLQYTFSLDDTLSQEALNATTMIEKNTTPIPDSAPGRRSWRRCHSSR